MAHAGIGAEVEGIHAVDAALATGRVTELIIERRRATSDDGSALIETARSTGVAVRTLASSVSIPTWLCHQPVHAMAPTQKFV